MPEIYLYGFGGLHPEHDGLGELADELIAGLAGIPGLGVEPRQVLPFFVGGPNVAAPRDYVANFGPLFERPARTPLVLRLTADVTAFWLTRWARRRDVGYGGVRVYAKPVRAPEDPGYTYWAGRRAEQLQLADTLLGAIQGVADIVGEVIRLQPEQATPYMTIQRDFEKFYETLV